MTASGWCEYNAANQSHGYGPTLNIFTVRWVPPSEFPGGFLARGSDISPWFVVLAQAMQVGKAKTNPYSKQKSVPVQTDH